MTEGGLHSFVARWYDPVVSRWLSPDTATPKIDNNFPQAKWIRVALTVDYRNPSILLQLGDILRTKLTNESKQIEETDSLDISDSIEKFDLSISKDFSNLPQQLELNSSLKNIGRAAYQHNDDYQNDEEPKNDKNSIPYTYISSVDRFGYVKNCPTHYSDPTGHQDCDAGMLIGAGLATAGGLIVGIVGAIFVTVGITEASTGVGVFEGIHLIGVGGLMIGVGIGGILLGGYLLVESDCIPFLDSESSTDSG